MVVLISTALIVICTIYQLLDFFLPFTYLAGWILTAWRYPILSDDVREFKISTSPNIVMCRNEGDQCKDSTCYLCLRGLVVRHWLASQEITRSNFIGYLSLNSMNIAKVNWENFSKPVNLARIPLLGDDIDWYMWTPLFFLSWFRKPRPISVVEKVSFVHATSFKTISFTLLWPLSGGFTIKIKWFNQSHYCNQLKTLLLLRYTAFFCAQSSDSEDVTKKACRSKFLKCCSNLQDTFSNLGQYCLLGITSNYHKMRLNN